MGVCFSNLFNCFAKKSEPAITEFEPEEREIVVDGRRFYEKIETSEQRDQEGNLITTETVTRTISVGEKEVTEVTRRSDGQEEVTKEENNFGLTPEEAALFREEWDLGWTPDQIYPENSEPGLSSSNETTWIPIEETEKHHRGKRHNAMKQRKPGHAAKPHSKASSDHEDPLNNDSKSVVSQDLVTDIKRRKRRKHRYVEESTVYSPGQQSSWDVPDGNEDIIQESISEERQLENLDRNEKRQDGKERHRPHGVVLPKVPPDDVQKVRAKETPLPEAQIRQQLDEMQRQISYLKKQHEEPTVIPTSKAQRQQGVQNLPGLLQPYKEHRQGPQEQPQTRQMQGPQTPQQRWDQRPDPEFETPQQQWHRELMNRTHLRRYPPYGAEPQMQPPQNQQYQQPLYGGTRQPQPIRQPVQQMPGQPPQKQDWNQWQQHIQNPQQPQRQPYMNPWQTQPKRNQQPYGEFENPRRQWNQEPVLYQGNEQRRTYGAEPQMQPVRQRPQMPERLGQQPKQQQQDWNERRPNPPQQPYNNQYYQPGWN